MKKLVLTSLVAGLIVALAGLANAALLEAVVVGEGTPSGIQTAQTYLSYLSSGSAYSARIAYSYTGDTVRVWDLSTSSYADLGNPYPGRWARVKGFSDAGYIAVNHADGPVDKCKYWDNSGGPWAWHDGNYNTQIGWHGVGSTESFDWNFFTYDFSIGAQVAYLSYPPPYTGMAAGPMNNNNDKVAYRYTGGYSVALWNGGSGGSWTAVPTSINRPTDINDAQVIVGYDETNGNAYAYEFATSTETQIPFLPGMTYIQPWAINNNGLVVGMQYPASGQNTTFLWDMNTNQIYDLNDPSVVDNLPYHLPGNNRLLTVSDINNNGVILALTGEGNRLILLVPEPATLGLLLIGGLALLRRRD